MKNYVVILYYTDKIDKIDKTDAFLKKLCYNFPSSFFLLLFWSIMNSSCWNDRQLILAKNKITFDDNINTSFSNPHPTPYRLALALRFSLTKQCKQANLDSIDEMVGFFKKLCHNLPAFFTFQILE